MIIRIDRQNDVPKITEPGKLVYSEKSDTLYIKTMREGVKSIGSLSSYVETDPVFTAWLATPPNVSIFTNDAGYLTSFSETDPIFSLWQSTYDNHADWDTAYGWGNHASAGYLTSSALTPYLTSATAAVTYQPIGSYLTSITSSNVTTALGYTPVTNARTLTINGTTYDLTADRSWTISTGTTYTFSTGLTNIVGTITSNLSTGVSGGQSVVGGTSSGNNLTLSSTSNATKGKILFGTSAYDEANNRLGIGTTNPVGILDIYKSDNANPLLMRIWNGGSGGAKLRFVSETGGTAQHQWTTDKFLAAIAANNTIGMQFRVGLNATEAALDASTRMTITTNGKVGIGTTTPANNLDVNGTAAVGLSQDIEGGGTKAGGALLVGSSTLVSSLGYGTLQDNVIQLGDNISTNYYAHSPSMAFSTNQTGVGQLVGRLIGVNSSLGTSEKRVAQISLHTDTATNNGKITLDVTNGTTFVSGITVKNSGNVGIQVNTPTAYLHLKAGTATASTAPLKFTAGTNLTTPENGAFEFDGTNLYFTVGGVRKIVTLT